MQSPQDRIAYHGDLEPFLKIVTANYEFGEYLGHEVKQNGYEDFNLVLETGKGKFFIKCFASWRSESDCERYLNIIHSAIKLGKVTTPNIYPNKNNLLLTTISIDTARVNLCAMQYLDRGSIWESNQPLDKVEQSLVIKEASKINTCEYHPTFISDSWAIINAAASYQKNKDQIDPDIRTVIEELLMQLKMTPLNDLPYAFVHGDIRSTNVMRHTDGQVYIIDFSVANWYPRIMDLAIICCDLIFTPKNPDEFQETYPWALAEYQKGGGDLTSQELKALPLFIKLAHAMNLIGASSVDATNYISQAENRHWLNLGKQGLRYITTNWHPS